jgi:small-conductance mechanosensitive channel
MVRELPFDEWSMSLRLLVLLAVGFFATLTNVEPVRAQIPADASVEAEIPTAPVEFDSSVLFRVRGVSSLPAGERAHLISERLTDVAADPRIPLDALHVVEDQGASRIMAADRPIMTVVDADAALEQVSRTTLVTNHLIRVRLAIVDYRNARSARALRRAAINSLVATILLVLSIAALISFWRWVDRLFARRLVGRIHGVGIQSFEVMRAERIAGALRSGLVLLRAAAFLGLALTYVGFMLSQWPDTRGLSRHMAAFAFRPLQVIGQGIARNIPSLVFLAVLFLVIRVVLRLVRLFFDAVTSGTVTLPRFDRDWAQPTYNIVRFAIIAFALIVAYPYIPGSESAAFKGVSVFIGIIFSLGSSTAIANLIAGYMLTYRRAFKVGDRVKIGDAVGEVLDVRLQVTHLRSPKNEELVIPNSQILGSQVLNYTSLAQSRGLILHTEVGIGYETPWRQVEAMLLMAAERTAGILLEPRPFVLERNLGDFAVTYELNVYCRSADAMPQLYAELHRHILDVFNEYGVQIMTPAYERDPAAPKIVQRKDWYIPPATNPPAKRAS